MLSAVRETLHAADQSPIFGPELQGSGGDGSDGSLVFLHGLANSGRIFAPLMAGLGEAGVPLTMRAPTMSADLFGDDDHPTAALNAWLRHVAPPPWHIVAHSMGGVIAGLLVRESPDDVASLTLINSPVPDTTDRLQTHLGFDKRGRALRKMLVAAWFGRWAGDAHPRPRSRLELGVARAALRGFIADPRSIGDQVLADALLNSRVSTGWAFSRMAKRVPAWGLRPAPGLRALIVLGGRDPLVDRRDHDRIAAAYPDGTIVVLPRAAHFAHLEAADQVCTHVANHLARA